MTEASGVGRPIMLRPALLEGARLGRRTHMTLAASFVPGRRMAVGVEARMAAERASAGAMRIPTPWTKLRAGDMLWVQEETAWCADAHDRLATRWFYTADLRGGHVPVPGGVKGRRYTTGKVDASKLPREASRFTLGIESVRLFRAQDISWEQIKAEGGFDPHQTKGAWWQFRYAYALGDWATNPEVCGITFRFVDGNIDTGERWVPDPGPDRSSTAALLRAMAEQGP